MCHTQSVKWDQQYAKFEEQVGKPNKGSPLYNWKQGQLATLDARIKKEIPTFFLLYKNWRGCEMARVWDAKTHHANIVLPPDQGNPTHHTYTRHYTSHCAAHRHGRRHLHIFPDNRRSIWGRRRSTSAIVVIRIWGIWYPSSSSSSAKNDYDEFSVHSRSPSRIRRHGIWRRIVLPHRPRPAEGCRR